MCLPELHVLETAVPPYPEVEQISFLPQYSYSLDASALICVREKRKKGGRGRGPNCNLPSSSSFFSSPFIPFFESISILSLRRFRVGFSFCETPTLSHSPPSRTILRQTRRDRCRCLLKRAFVCRFMTTRLTNESPFRPQGECQACLSLCPFLSVWVVHSTLSHVGIPFLTHISRCHCKTCTNTYEEDGFEIIISGLITPKSISSCPEY